MLPEILRGFTLYYYSSMFFISIDRNYSIRLFFLTFLFFLFLTPYTDSIFSAISIKPKLPKLFNYAVKKNSIKGNHSKFINFHIVTFKLLLEMFNMRKKNIFEYLYLKILDYFHMTICRGMFFLRDKSFLISCHFFHLKSKFTFKVTFDN